MRDRTEKVVKTARVHKSYGTWVADRYEDGVWDEGRAYNFAWSARLSSWLWVRRDKPTPKVWNYGRETDGLR